MATGKPSTMGSSGGPRRPLQTALPTVLQTKPPHGNDARAASSSTIGSSVVNPVILHHVQLTPQKLSVGQKKRSGAFGARAVLLFILNPLTPLQTALALVLQNKSPSPLHGNDASAAASSMGSNRGPSRPLQTALALVVQTKSPSPLHRNSAIRSCSLH